MCASHLTQNSNSFGSASAGSAIASLKLTAGCITAICRLDGRIGPRGFLCFCPNSSLLLDLLMATGVCVSRLTRNFNSFGSASAGSALMSLTLTAGCITVICRLDGRNRPQWFCIPSENDLFLLQVVRKQLGCAAFLDPNNDDKSSNTKT